MAGELLGALVDRSLGAPKGAVGGHYFEHPANAEHQDLRGSLSRHLISIPVAPLLKRRQDLLQPLEVFPEAIAKRRSVDLI